MAPPEVKTTQIYKGAFAFIVLQLAGLAVAGYFPSLVNYMPYRTYLTSETAPPPVNPRLQFCMERRVFAEYRDTRTRITDGIDRAHALDLSVLPGDHRTALADGVIAAGNTFALVEQIASAETELNMYLESYRPLQREVRRTQIGIRKLERKINQAQTRHDRLRRNRNATQRQLEPLEQEIARLQQSRQALIDSIPADWNSAKATYTALVGADQQARRAYRRNVDNAYQSLDTVRAVISQAEPLAMLEEQLAGLAGIVAASPATQAMAEIKQVESKLSNIAGAGQIKSLLSKSRRALQGDNPNSGESRDLLQQALARFHAEIKWRTTAAKSLLPALDDYNDTIKNTIGLRLQKRLTTEQAKDIAACQSAHRDISLNF